MSAGESLSRDASLGARYFNAFRLASYLLALYAVGHTWGAVINVPRFGPESDSVVSMMQSVHVHVELADCTWYGFYRGFGWFVSLYLVFSTFLAWRLGGMSERQRPALLPLAWALFLCQAGTVPVVWTYFFPIPMAYTTLITVLLAVGCIREWRRARSALPLASS